MSKLLRSNFSRLWRSKIFWLCMVSMLAYALAYMLSGCRRAAMDMSGYAYTLDEYYFQFAIVIGLFSSVCGSMFFGTEYSDGTIRNKIIVGHTRASIYMACLMTTFTATLLIMSVWLFGALIAVPVLGLWKMDALKLFLYMLIAVMSVLAFSAVLTAVNMLSSSKAVTVIISILLFFGLSAFAGVVYNILSEPEMSTGVQITQNGLDITEPTPNPNYVTGVTREIYDFIIDFLPTGQSIRLWQLEVAHPIRMLASSLFIASASTVGGVLAFKKKNIK